MIKRTRINRNQFNHLAVSYARAYIKRVVTYRAEEFIRENLSPGYYANSIDIDGIKELSAAIVNEFGADYMFEDFCEINQTLLPR